MVRLGAFLSVLILAGAGCAPAPAPLIPADVPVPQSEPVVTPTPSSAYIPDAPGNPVPTVRSQEELAGKRLRISTAKGDIVIELFGDTAPIAVSSFVHLAEQGFYDGVVFHRRESWVLQGGDPTGTGSGGAGYRFPEELNDSYAYARGMVGVAKTMAPSTSGSQFFFILTDTPLPKQYTIFGRVVEGLDVMDTIAIGDKMTSVSVE